MERMTRCQRLIENKRTVRKKLILSILIILSTIGLGFIVKVKLNKESDKININEENLVEENEKKDDSGITNNEKRKSLDNSGYLPLEKDSNADDAIIVGNTTEKLLKEEIKFPVRSDGKKVVYLTFDDGPSTTNTPKVLDILKLNGIKATFMIFGRNLDGSQEAKAILKRTVEEGHAIGNHTYSHDYGYLYPNGIINVDNFMSDIEKCNDTLKHALGKDFSTRVIRFPGGYWSWGGRINVRSIIDQKGYDIIDWNTLSEDAQGKTNKNAKELIEVTKINLASLGANVDNVVFLMHDTYGKEETVKSLQGIINIFREKGFEFRTIK
ncbi:polysaccharide deacetylase [Clostridium sp. SHJSY1]|uniref:polysaccharide deacetylase family protein n=1 Tax=Clostridium sp. SHJSY1 TaxID=2942483 RepID=UPI0028771EBF|nr:polysaccharide deacetylase family protein [Clostridium sp. SHJSY1]MDS0525213.1 polysaccharide deacetylase [Clostridium sp. SHJSY1]